MSSRKLWNLIRMSIGSMLGIIGFGSLSMGFVNLSGGEMIIGFLEILAGTLLALGVISPLRKSHRQHPQI